MENTRPLLEFLELHAKLNDARRSVGPSIRAARKAQGITQSSFAAAMGKSQTYLSLVENGKKTPSTGSVERAISVLTGAEGGTPDGEDQDEHQQDQVAGRGEAEEGRQGEGR